MRGKILFYNVVLFIAHISSQWETYFLSYLQLKDPDDPTRYQPEEYYNIKVALNLTQFQFTLITGAVFTFTNGFTGLAIGYYADKINRKWLLFGAAIGWNFFSLMISFTQNFWQILIVRICYSMCMAGCVTCSVTLIADYCEPSERGFAQSLFALGVYMGVGFSSVSIALDKQFGWRHTIQIISGVNLAFAFLIIFLDEPKRNVTNQNLEGVNVVESQGDTYDDYTETREPNESKVNRSTDNAAKESMLDDGNALANSQKLMADLYNPDLDFDVPLSTKLKIMFSNKCYLYLSIASFFRFFGGYSLGFISATFYETRYPDNVSDYSYMNTVIVIGGGLPACMIGGWMSDNLEKRFPTIKGQISGVGALVALPFIIFTYIIQPGFWWAIWSYWLAYFTAEMWYGPSHAQINNLFPSQFQGLAIAIFNLAGTISGTIATTLMGIFLQKWDAEDAHPENAGYVLGAAVIFSYGFAAPFFLLSGYEYKKILKERAEREGRKSIAESFNSKRDTDM